MTIKQKVGDALRWQGQDYAIERLVPRYVPDDTGDPVLQGVAVRAVREQGYERHTRETRGGGTDTRGPVKKDDTGNPVRIAGVEFLPDICVSDYSAVRTNARQLQFCNGPKHYKALLAVSLGRVMTQIPQQLDDDVKNLARGLAVAVRDRLQADCPVDGFWFHPYMHFPKFQYPAPFGSSPLSVDEWRAAVLAYLEGETDG